MGGARVVEVATVGGGQGWETALVAAAASPGTAVTVVRRCADLADLLAVVVTGQVRVCVLWAELRHLTSDAVEAIAAAGSGIVAVHRSDDTTIVPRLNRIGITTTVAGDAAAGEIITAIHAAVPSTTPTTPPRHADPQRPLRMVEDPTGASAATTGTRTPGVIGAADRDDAPSRRRRSSHRRRRGGAARRRAEPATAGSRAGGAGDPGAPTGASGGSGGTVIAVWGPGGAPGRTTVASLLAERIATAGQRVLLIDADVYGGVLASAFGLLEESPGLAGACRLAAQGRLDRESLVNLAWSVGDRLELLTGIARADRWPELRPSTIPTILALARSHAPVTVVDCSAPLEQDEELSFDTLAPRRHGATLAVLAEADRVLAVGSADAPGMGRLVRGLAELEHAVPDAQPQVVINRLRPTAYSAVQVDAALRRFGCPAPIAGLPEDRASCDLAWQQGVALGLAAPRSPLVKEIRRLIAALDIPSAALAAMP